MEADRSLVNQATQAGKTATGVGGTYGSEAGTLQAGLIPTLEREAAGGMGLTPTQKAQELTAAEQGAGGAAGSIAGGAGLTAARTRNSAALSGVQDAAARARTQAGSNANLAIENQSTNLANQRQQAGLNALQGLYGTDVRAQLGAMGIVPEDVNAATNASKVGWLQDVESGVDTATGAFKALYPKGLQG